MILDIPDTTPVSTVIEIAKSLGLKVKFSKDKYVLRKDVEPKGSNVRFLRANTPDDEPTPPSAA
jgi:hypothetical protein